MNAKHALSPAQKRGAALLAALLALAGLLLAVRAGQEMFFFSVTGADFAAGTVDHRETEDALLTLEPGQTASVADLTLEAGSYRLTMEYAAEGADGLLVVESPGDLQPDNTAGLVLLRLELPAGGGPAEAVLEVPRRLADLCFRAESGAGTLTLSHLDLSGQAAHRDEAVLFALAALAALALAAAGLGRRQPAAGSVLAGRAVSGRRVFFALLACMLALSAFLTAPLLGGELPAGTDYPFHIARIQAIADGLASGQFPVRVYPGLLNGWGYPSGLFYPDLLLYLPALLRLAGMSLAGCYTVFFFLVQLATLAAGHIAFSRLLGSRAAGFAAAAVYALNPYRLLCLYQRSSAGEFCAMIFLPLAVAGLCEVLWGEAGRWPLLCLGMTGLAMTHLLTLELAALGCLVAVLVALPRLWREKGRVLAGCKAAGLTVLLSLWFLLPMAYTALRWRWAVFARKGLVYGDGALGGLLALPDLDRQQNALGLALLAGVLALAVYLLLFARQKGEERLRALGAGALAAGAAAVLLTTVWGPWGLLNRIGPLARLLGSMQFTSRLFALAMPLLALAAGCGLRLWLKRPGALHAGAAGLALLAALSVWPALGRVEAVSEHRGGDASVVNLQYSTTACIGQGEYLMEGADLNTMLLQGPAVTCSDPGAVLTGVERQGAGMKLHYALSAGAEGQYLLLPISYAPGFSAFVNGEEAPVLLYGNQQLRVELPCAEGDVEVRYDSLTLFRLSEAVSLAALAGCVLWPLARRRARRA